MLFHDLFSEEETDGKLKLFLVNSNSEYTLDILFLKAQVLINVCNFLFIGNLVNIGIFLIYDNVIKH